MSEIEIVRMMEHYLIYVNGKFYCSCENRNEVDEAIEEINELDEIASLRNKIAGNNASGNT